MDLKLFLVVGLCCVLRASADDMRNKGMQALKSGQLRRTYSRFGRNFVMPEAPVDGMDDLTPEEEKQWNEILNWLGEEESGMADNKWHLPLDKQFLKYLWSTKSRNTAN